MPVTPGVTYGESFAGIIGAFNDVRVANDTEARLYPHNFAGIIKAVMDLRDWGTARVDEYPQGWKVFTDPNTGEVTGGEWQFIPKDGEFWYDTRQGRLMVWCDDGFYQANGADGLTAVSETSPDDREVIGAQWWNTSNDSLYIWTGTSWSLLGTVQGSSWDINGLGIDTSTTTELNGLRVDTLLPDPAGIANQSQLNNWDVNALEALDSAILDMRPNAKLTSSDNAPAVDVIEGDLWFDNITDDLKVWHGSENGGSWLPCLSIDAQAQIDALNASVSTLTTNLNSEIASTNADITSLLSTDSSNLSTTTGLISALTTRVTTLENEPAVDLSPFETEVDHDADVLAINAAIAVVDAKTFDPAPYALTSSVNSEVTTLQTDIDTRALATTLTSEIATVTAAIPDVTGKADITYVDSEITSAINAIDLSTTTITDSVAVTKTDLSKTTLDFTGENWYGNNAFKFKTNDNLAANNYATFGLTSDLWEYNWGFEENEDFCWTHGTNGKVCSVNKNGVAATELTLGTFSTNDANGVVINNPVQVGTRLTTYQTAFEAMRTAINSSTDYATLKSGLLTALAGI